MVLKMPMKLADEYTMIPQLENIHLLYQSYQREVEWMLDRYQAVL